MDVDNYKDLLPLIVLGAFFFVSAIAALYWAAQRGQLRNFDAQANTIFTSEEPEGEISDSFPSKHSAKTANSN